MVKYNIYVIAHICYVHILYVCIYVCMHSCIYSRSTSLLKTESLVFYSDILINSTIDLNSFKCILSKTFIEIFLKHILTAKYTSKLVYLCRKLRKYEPIS